VRISRAVASEAVGEVGQHAGVGAVEKGGELTRPNPTDRGKAGSKYHILCDANGLPLHALLSAANTHDSTLFKPLLDKNPAVRARRGRPGWPRRRPEELHADKGYDYRRCREYLHRRGIKVRIARRGINDKSAPCPGSCASSDSDCTTTAQNAQRSRYSPSPAPSSTSAD
jgi:transposase